jgi:pimeloyl-ACP methyl ester carboxylesterase
VAVVSGEVGAQAAAAMVAGRRRAWALLSLATPALVERAALKRFATPPTTLPAPPAIEGVHQFWVDGDHGRICTYDWGTRGPTILLAHGWGGTAAQLSRFVRPLLAAGFHVVAFDQPAHGASAGRQATVVDFARATAAVAAKLDHVHGVIAHSLGATGAALALDHGLAAERLALLAPPVEMPFFARAFGASLGLPPPRVDGMLRRISRSVGGFERLDLRRRAPAFTSAALIVHDVRDREVPYDQAVALALAWPAARLRTVERLGHRRLLADAGVIRAAIDFMRADEAGLRRSA